MSWVETMTLAVNDSWFPSPARKKSACSTAVSLVVVAVLTPDGSVAVHLNGVLLSSDAVSQRTPCPCMHPASGPLLTVEVHRKAPPEWMNPVAELNAPPPVRKTAPEAPEMFGAMKPKPVSLADGRGG
jgi:hypothetical protein